MHKTGGFRLRCAYIFEKHKYNQRLKVSRKQSISEFAIHIFEEKNLYSAFTFKYFHLRWKKESINFFMVDYYINYFLFFFLLIHGRFKNLFKYL
jgi:hypothetical protein